MSKSKLRFTDVSTEYMEFRKPELRPTTYASYMHLLKRRIIPVVGSIKIKDFNNDVLQGFIDVESAAGYGKHGIRDCVSIIKLVLRYAADMKYGKYKIRTIKYHRGCSGMRREHSLTKDEYNKLLTYCIENPGERTFPTLIAMTTGMRIGIEHLTHGREVYVPISADGLISAIGKLHEYEANTRAPILSAEELKKVEEIT